MKRFSLPQAASSGEAGQALECFILDGRSEVDRSWVKAQSGLEATLVEALCTLPPRTGHTQVAQSGVLSLVRADEANEDVLVGVNLLVGADRVLAVCFGTGTLVETALARFVELAGGGVLTRLLAMIVSALVRPLESEMAKIADAIDELEDKVMAGTDESLDDSVVLLARRILGLRRYLVPMREELSYLALNAGELPRLIEPRYLRRAAEYPGRLISALDSSLQRINLILDQLRKRDDGRMARSMHKLTIVGTVFLPLSFITGLLGINVAGVPGEHDPLAFWLVCGFLIAVAVGSIVVIRWRKWL